MRRKPKRALLYLLLYIVSVAVVLWLSSIAFPGSVSTWQGFLVVLGLALIGAVGVVRFLVFIFELWFKPIETTKKPLLSSVSLTDLKYRLTDRGDIPWIDRGITNPDIVNQHSFLVIQGEMKCGKTREAIELISRAIETGNMPPGSIYEPALFFESLDSQTITKELQAQFASHISVILFVDDLFRIFSTSERLDLLTAALKGLRHCSKVLVVATGRLEELNDQIQTWLDRQQGLIQIPLENFTSSYTEDLVNKVSEREHLPVDDDALSELISPEFISPEQIILGFRYHKDQGVDRVDREKAIELVSKTLVDLWSVVRDRINKHYYYQSKYLFSALDTFYAAKVFPFVPLVLDYAATLFAAEKDNIEFKSFSTLLSRKSDYYRRRLLNQALNGLSSYIPVQDDIIKISDAALEDRIDIETATQRLGEYLTHHRSFFAHRGLRRLYPHAEMHAWGLFYLALSAQTRGEISTAVKLYSSALNLFQHYGFYNNRGTTYFNMEDYQAALADYTRAIELNPQFAAAYWNRGISYYDLEDYQAALADFTRAIELNPEDAAAYYNRANIYDDLEDYHAALADYTRVIELNPEYAAACYNRGLTYSKLEDYQAALADYTRAIELNPQHAKAYNNRGNTYFKLEDYQVALIDYTRAIELNPEEGVYYCNRAESLIHLSKLDEAKSDCLNAERLDPEDPCTIGIRAKLFYAQGEYVESEIRYRQASDLGSDPAEFNFDIALPLLCLDRPEEALTLIKSRLQVHEQPSDLSVMLLEYEKLLSEKPDLPGLEEALNLLRSAA